MEVKELMIGDWVFLHESPRQVNYLEDNDNLTSSSIGFYGISAAQNSNHVHPIPITEGILNKIGLYAYAASEDFHHFAYCHIESFRHIIFIHDEHLLIIENNWISNVQYVHELQHAFRFYGLNELAEGFTLLTHPEGEKFPYGFCNNGLRKDNMEHKIGTRITLEVVGVENDKCDGCYFDCFTCNKPKDWICHSRERSDHKNVIFKEIKED